MIPTVTVRFAATGRKRSISRIRRRRKNLEFHEFIQRNLTVQVEKQGLDKEVAELDLFYIRIDLRPTGGDPELVILEDDC